MGYVPAPIIKVPTFVNVGTSSNKLGTYSWEPPNGVTYSSYTVDIVYEDGDEVNPGFVSAGYFNGGSLNLPASTTSITLPTYADVPTNDPYTKAIFGTVQYVTTYWLEVSAKSSNAFDIPLKTRIMAGQPSMARFTLNDLNKLIVPYPEPNGAWISFDNRIITGGFGYNIDSFKVYKDGVLKTSPTYSVWGQNTINTFRFTEYGKYEIRLLSISAYLYTSTYEFYLGGPTEAQSVGVTLDSQLNYTITDPYKSYGQYEFNVRSHFPGKEDRSKVTVLDAGSTLSSKLNLTSNQIYTEFNIASQHTVVAEDGSEQTFTSGSAPINVPRRVLPIGSVVYSEDVDKTVFSQQPDVNFTITDYFTGSNYDFEYLVDGGSCEVSGTSSINADIQYLFVLSLQGQGPEEVSSVFGTTFTESYQSDTLIIESTDTSPSFAQDNLPAFSARANIFVTERVYTIAVIQYSLSQTVFSSFRPSRTFTFKPKMQNGIQYYRSGAFSGNPDNFPHVVGCSPTYDFSGPYGPILANCYTIQDGAFSSNNTIQNFNFPNSVVRIGSKIFASGTHLNTLSFSFSLPRGAGGFDSATAFEGITVDNVKIYGGSSQEWVSWLGARGLTIGADKISTVTTSLSPVTNIRAEAVYGGVKILWDDAVNTQSNILYTVCALQNSFAYPQSTNNKFTIIPTSGYHPDTFKTIAILNNTGNIKIFISARSPTIPIREFTPVSKTITGTVDDSPNSYIGYNATYALGANNDEVAITHTVVDKQGYFALNPTFTFQYQLGFMTDMPPSVGYFQKLVKKVTQDVVSTTIVPNYSFTLGQPSFATVTLTFSDAGITLVKNRTLKNNSFFYSYSVITPYGIWGNGDYGYYTESPMFTPLYNSITVNWPVEYSASHERYLDSFLIIVVPDLITSFEPRIGENDLKVKHVPIYQRYQYEVSYADFIANVHTFSGLNRMGTDAAWNPAWNGVSNRNYQTNPQPRIINYLISIRETHIAEKRTNTIVLDNNSIQLLELPVLPPVTNVQVNETSNGLAVSWEDLENVGEDITYSVRGVSSGITFQGGPTSDKFITIAPATGWGDVIDLWISVGSSTVPPVETNFVNVSIVKDTNITNMAYLRAPIIGRPLASTTNENNAVFSWSPLSGASYASYSVDFEFQSGADQAFQSLGYFGASPLVTTSTSLTIPLMVDDPANAVYTKSLFGNARLSVSNLTNIRLVVSGNSTYAGDVSQKATILFGDNVLTTSPVLGNAYEMLLDEYDIESRIRIPKSIIDQQAGSVVIKNNGLTLSSGYSSTTPYGDIMSGNENVASGADYTTVVSDTAITYGISSFIGKFTLEIKLGNLVQASTEFYLTGIKSSQTPLPIVRGLRVVNNKCGVKLAWDEYVAPANRTDIRFQIIARATSSNVLISLNGLTGSEAFFPIQDDINSVASPLLVGTQYEFTVSAYHGANGNTTGDSYFQTPESPSVRATPSNDFKSKFTSYGILNGMLDVQWSKSDHTNVKDYVLSFPTTSVKVTIPHTDESSPILQRAFSSSDGLTLTTTYNPLLQLVISEPPSQKYPSGLTFTCPGVQANTVPTLASVVAGDGVLTVSLNNGGGVNPTGYNVLLMRDDGTVINQFVTSNQNSSETTYQFTSLPHLSQSNAVLSYTLSASALYGELESISSPSSGSYIVGPQVVGSVTYTDSLYTTVSGVSGNNGSGELSFHPNARTIKDGAFSNCARTTFTIPEFITNFGDSSTQTGVLNPTITTYDITLVGISNKTFGAKSLVSGSGNFKLVPPFLEVSNWESWHTNSDWSGTVNGTTKYTPPTPPLVEVTNATAQYDASNIKITLVDNVNPAPGVTLRYMVSVFNESQLVFSSELTADLVKSFPARRSPGNTLISGPLVLHTTVSDGIRTDKETTITNVTISGTPPPPPPTSPLVDPSNITAAYVSSNIEITITDNANPAAGVTLMYALEVRDSGNTPVYTSPATSSLFQSFSAFRSGDSSLISGPLSVHVTVSDGSRAPKEASINSIAISGTPPSLPPTEAQTVGITFDSQLNYTITDPYNAYAQYEINLLSYTPGKQLRPKVAVLNAGSGLTGNLSSNLEDGQIYQSFKIASQHTVTDGVESQFTSDYSVIDSGSLLLQVGGQIYYVDVNSTVFSGAPTMTLTKTEPSESNNLFGSFGYSGNAAADSDIRYLFTLSCEDQGPSTKPTLFGTSSMESYDNTLNGWTTSDTLNYELQVAPTFVDSDGVVQTRNFTIAAVRYSLSQKRFQIISSSPFTFTLPTPPPANLLTVSGVTARYDSSNIEITIVDTANPAPGVTLEYEVEVVDSDGATVYTSPAGSSLVRSFSAFHVSGNTLISGPLLAIVTVSDGSRTPASSNVLNIPITGTAPQPPPADLAAVTNVAAERVSGAVQVTFDDLVNPAVGLTLTYTVELVGTSLPPMISQTTSVVFPLADASGEEYPRPSSPLTISVTVSDGTRSKYDVFNGIEISEPPPADLSNVTDVKAMRVSGGLQVTFNDPINPAVGVNLTYTVELVGTSFPQMPSQITSVVFPEMNESGQFYPTPTSPLSIKVTVSDGTRSTSLVFDDIEISEPPTGLQPPVSASAEYVFGGIQVTLVPGENEENGLVYSVFLGELPGQTTSSLTTVFPSRDMNGNGYDLPSGTLRISASVSDGTTHSSVAEFDVPLSGAPFLPLQHTPLTGFTGGSIDLGLGLDPEYATRITEFTVNVNCRVPYETNRVNAFRSMNVVGMAAGCYVPMPLYTFADGSLEEVYSANFPDTAGGTGLTFTNVVSFSNSSLNVDPPLSRGEDISLYSWVAFGADRLRIDWKDHTGVESYLVTLSSDLITEYAGTDAQTPIFGDFQSVLVSPGMSTYTFTGLDAMGEDRLSDGDTGPPRPISYKISVVPITPSANTYSMYGDFHQSITLAPVTDRGIVFEDSSRQTMIGTVEGFDFSGVTAEELAVTMKTVKKITAGAFVNAPLVKVLLPQGLEDLGGAAYSSPEPAPGTEPAGRAMRFNEGNSAVPVFNPATVEITFMGQLPVIAPGALSNLSAETVVTIPTGQDPVVFADAITTAGLEILPADIEFGPPVVMVGMTGSYNGPSTLIEVSWEDTASRYSENPPRAGYANVSYDIGVARDTGDGGMITYGEGVTGLTEPYYLFTPDNWRHTFQFAVSRASYTNFTNIDGSTASLDCVLTNSTNTVVLSKPPETYPVSDLNAFLTLGGVKVQWMDGLNVGVDNYNVVLTLENGATFSHQTGATFTVFPFQDDLGNPATGMPPGSIVVGASVEADVRGVMSESAALTCSLTGHMPPASGSFNFTPTWADSNLSIEILDNFPLNAIQYACTLTQTPPYMLDYPTLVTTSQVSADASGETIVNLTSSNYKMYSAKVVASYSVDFPDSDGGMGLTYSNEQALNPGSLYLTTPDGLFTNSNDSSIDLHMNTYYGFDQIKVVWTPIEGPDYYVVTVISDLITGFTSDNQPIYGNSQTLIVGASDDPVAIFGNLNGTDTDASSQTTPGVMRTLAYAVSVVPVWTSTRMFNTSNDSIVGIILSQAERDGVYFSDNSFKHIVSCDENYDFSGLDGPNLTGVVTIGDDAFAYNNTIENVNPDTTLACIGDPVFAPGSRIAFTFKGTTIPNFHPEALEGITITSISVPNNLDWYSAIRDAGWEEPKAELVTINTSTVGFPSVRNMTVTPVEAGVRVSWVAPNMVGSTEQLSGYAVVASLQPFTGASFDNVILLPSEIDNSGVEDVLLLPLTTNTVTFRIVDDSEDDNRGALDPTKSYYFSVVSVGDDTGRAISISALIKAGPVQGASISSVNVVGNSLKVNFTPLANSTHSVSYNAPGVIGGNLPSTYKLTPYNSALTYTFTLRTTRSISFAEYGPTPYLFTASPSSMPWSMGGGSNNGGSGNSGGTGHNTMAADLTFRLVLSNDASQSTLFHVAGEGAGEAIPFAAYAQVNVPLSSFNSLLVFASDWDGSLTSGDAGASGDVDGNPNGQPLVALRLDLVAGKLNELDDKLKTPAAPGQRSSDVTFKDDNDMDADTLTKWFAEYSGITGMVFTNSILDNGILETGAVSRITQAGVTGPKLGDRIAITYDSAGEELPSGGETALYSLFEQAMAAGKVLGPTASAPSSYVSDAAAWSGRSAREATFAAGDKITLFVEYDLTKERKYLVDTENQVIAGQAVERLSFTINNVTYTVPLTETSGVGKKTYKIVMNAVAS